MRCRRSLEDLLQGASSPVELLRNSQAAPYTFPVASVDLPKSRHALFHSEPDTEVTLVRAKKGRSSKPAVERRVQTGIRATVALAPIAEFTRIPAGRLIAVGDDHR